MLAIIVTSLLVNPASPDLEASRAASRALIFTACDKAVSSKAARRLNTPFMYGNAQETHSSGDVGGREEEEVEAEPALREALEEVIALAFTLEPGKKLGLILQVAESCRWLL